MIIMLVRNDDPPPIDPYAIGRAKVIFCCMLRIRQKLGLGLIDVTTLSTSLRFSMQSWKENRAACFPTSTCSVRKFVEGVIKSGRR